MKNTKRLVGLLLAAAFCCTFIISQTTAERRYRVKWVPDGDTILLDDGRFVRYIGINTPEVAKDGQPGEPFAAAARNRNQDLIGGAFVRLEFDASKKDRYGRLLAYVSNHEGRMINAVLVAEGLAWCLPVSTNEKHRRRLLTAQQGAMAAGNGLWARLSTTEGPVVGNRRSLRFHRPDCPNALKMSSRNRKTFSSVRDAFHAGYAPAKNCLPPTRLFRSGLTHTP